MKITISSMILLVGLTSPIQAQQSILSAGGNGSGPGGSFSYSIGQIGYSSFGNSNITIEQGVQHSYNSRSIVNLKLFIEGYYENGGFMKSVMNNQDYVSPITDVEYINIELLNPNSPYAVLHATTALLKTDGTAIGNFESGPNGLFYLVIKARNSLQTWSATPQTLGSTPLTYDFTNASGKAFGNNMTEVEPGVFAFYSGDINQDEVIDNSDGVDLLNDIDNSEFGVKVTDLNGDGSVDNSDAPYFFNNAENSVFSVHP